METLIPRTRTPRRLAAAAALLCLLALGGCETSDSGSGPSTNYNGFWEGATSTGGRIQFQVASDKISDLKFEHIENGCTWTMLWSQDEPITIEENRFAYRSDEPGRHRLFAGSFSSDRAAEGSYSFRGLADEGTTCVNNGQGSFTVAWVR